MLEASGEKLRDKAYRILRDRIVRMEYAPMFPLNEKKLSAELEVGIQPIREAIRRLEFEHLVTVFPRQGTFVSAVGLRHELLVHEVRAEIEGLCAARSATRASEAERVLLVQLAEANRGRTGIEAMDGDSAFHRALYESSHNEFLEKTLNQYFNLSLRIWYWSASQFDLPTENIEIDHTATAKAIMDRDPDLASSTIMAHIHKNSSDLLKILAAGGVLSGPIASITIEETP